jgi:ribosomal-protein-alanine N-acetyltransferase
VAVTVAEAGIEHLEALYNIETECFTHEAFSKKQIASLLRSPNSLSLLAKLNDEVVGFIIVQTYERKKRKLGHIYTLDVVEKARKRGIGLKLLRAAEQILRADEIDAVILEVRVDNMAARELYRKWGFTEVGRLKNFYSGVDGLRMQKKLQ